MSKMPALFVGHGAPMNAVEDNAFARTWLALGREMPRPKAILCISGHWVEHGVTATSSVHPSTYHDFYGFPEDYYRLRYPAPGDPALAARLSEVLATPVRLDAERGLDHGVWAVLCRMYPEADVPVVQLGLDADRPLPAHYELAKRLDPLRDEGILVMGSGNIVHNLSMFRLGQAAPADWALRFDTKVRELVVANDVETLANPGTLGTDARLAVPTAEHYVPLLYTLAVRRPDDALSFFNESVSSTVSMTSFALQ
jgi:4,5-DOPA dioxygenase extradiol